MYILYAPPEKFGSLPPKTPLLSDEVLFTHNIAYCPKFYWRKHHVLQGCRDVTPGWMVRMRRRRNLRKILVIATGGFGDVMWTMPVIKQLRVLYPRARIVVATKTRTQPIFLQVPYADLCVNDDYWNLQSLIRAADEVYDFGGIATILKKEMRREPVEACFFHADIPRPSQKKDMRPHLVVTLSEGKRAEELLRKNGVSPEEDTIVTIALESSTPNRNWVFSYVKALTSRLISDGKKVVWLSESKDFGNSYFLECQCGWEFELTTQTLPDGLVFRCPQCKRTITADGIQHPEGVVNLGGKTAIREAMAIIALSDVFVGPNSGLMVVATSLEIPSVGLFGAFSPRRIAKYYEKFQALWGRPDCAPCHEHWTECPRGHPAPCMKMISWEQVYHAVEDMLRRYPRSKIGKLPIS